MLTKDVVLVACEPLEQWFVLCLADVAESDEGVAPQPTHVVARHVETVEAVDESEAVFLEPRHEIDVAVPGLRQVRTSLLHSAVPRADVLADVAAVHLRAELSSI